MENPSPRLLGVLWLLGKILAFFSPHHVSFGMWLLGRKMIVLSLFGLKTPHHVSLERCGSWENSCIFSPHHGWPTIGCVALEEKKMVANFFGQGILTLWQEGKHVFS